jgi:hypothetical protein
MAVSAQENTNLSNRWGVTLGDSRPKTSKALIVNVAAIQLLLIRNQTVNTTGNQFDTAWNDALAWVNTMTEDARGLRS